MDQSYKNPKIIAVAGTSSNSGKTTLVCELLRDLTQQGPWEAIKLSRGHYRSCGKDPHACCVSGLLGAEPVVRSGRAANDTAGKDTGRYWEAGASNVHWIIASDEQVEAGLRVALARVTAPGVIVEGTSSLRYLAPDFAILAVSDATKALKPSARYALAHQKIDALFVADATQPRPPLPAENCRLPVYDLTRRDALLAQIRVLL